MSHVKQEMFSFPDNLFLFSFIDIHLAIPIVYVSLFPKITVLKV